ncbi:NADH:flavin oxidoreductase [Clostridium sp. UBA6640]|uniref:NADH:flavin oxidoreductase n=1 Tax=Clostridium sp. UBA6640 TaxID=1946370 RepID=UPI0025C660A2|nr:NADH:flavin oxidoreductase [Clostridium sp. UBA6640]
MTSEKVLLKPIKIGDVKINNRVAMAPMNMNFTGPNHYPSKQQEAYYVARSIGGTGLIIIEAMLASEHPTANTYRKYNNLSITDERYVPQLANMVERIKVDGAVVFAQLSIGPGRQGTSDLGATTPVSASPIPFEVRPDKLINGLGSPENIKPLKAFVRTLGYQGELSDDIEVTIEQAKKIPGSHLISETPRELTKKEIKKLVEDYGYSAKCTKLAGFDGIEIHAPHGYLLHSFISPHTNKRNDEYGGSLENRLRIIKESIDSMRKYVGPDYPIGVRISASEEVEDGMTPEYVNKVAKKLEEYGADFIHLSDGSYECMSDFLPNNDGQVVEKARIINKDLNIPLICPSVHDPKLAEKVIRENIADMISQGRQQIADPDWVNKYKEDRMDEIIKCTRCNEGCIKRFMMGLPARCIVNPITGYEEHIERYSKRSIDSINNNRQWKVLNEIGKEPSSYME